jgi:hypothetical protein
VRELCAEYLNPGMHRLLFAVAWLLAGASIAPAQEPLRKESSGLVLPAEVVLYIHSDLKSTDFVQPLVCTLQRVLTASVSTQILDLPLGPELLATSTQFDVGKVADRFIRTIGRVSRRRNPPVYRGRTVDSTMLIRALRAILAVRTSEIHGRSFAPQGELAQRIPPSSFPYVPYAAGYAGACHRAALCADPLG